MREILNNHDLLKEAAYVNGAFITSDTMQPIYNPATNILLGSVPQLSEADIELSIEAAHTAFQKWSALTAKERAQYLMDWYHLILKNQEDLAKIMTFEQGKPLTESRGEILYAASFIEWFAEEGKRIYGDIIPSPHKDKRILVLKQPIGVVGAITPWNFPAAMITRKAGPALAAGCTIIIKPAPETPFSAIAMAVLAEQAGIPPGVLNVVTGDAAMIGKHFMQSNLVKKVSFTGSTEVGQELIRLSAETVKKLSLELGGHAPFIVFPDADLHAAAKGALISKYRNMGQTCVCANRFFIHEDIYDAFSHLFLEEVKQLKLGNGLEPGISQGPLINKSAFEKTTHHVEDALAKGAHLLYGGKPYTTSEHTGYFYEPTILQNAQPNMLLAQEETFGPVAPLFSFQDEDEVIEQANNTPYGLAAYFYGQNIGQIFRVAEALEYGIIGVNTGIISTEVAPFGGVKASGFGREGSKYGIEEYVTLKYVSLGL